MCYTSASAAKSAAKQALFNGTLILLVPPVLIFAIIIVVIFRYRNKFRDVPDWRPQHDRELREMLSDLEPAVKPETEIWHDPSVVGRP
jgi:heme/copper-type cytochrome/quinol oxidase subunit 2